MRMGKYMAVRSPTHPRRTKQGIVYVHMLIAEEALGRALKPSEVVHHLDRNKLNNSADNLIVFASNSDHMRFHANGCDEKTLVLNGDGAYFCNRKKSIADKSICPICGRTKDRKAKSCLSCHRKQAASLMPDALELKRVLTDLNWNFSAAGRVYSVSDNAVRKWCKKYGIPCKHMHR